MQASNRDLAFLLALGSLPLACGDATSETSQTTTGTDSDGDSASSTSSAVPTTSGDPSTGEDPTETFEPTDPTCIAYAKTAAECDPDPRFSYEYIAYLCEYTKMYVQMMGGEACADAFDAFLACLSTLTCEELNGDGESDACQDEFETADELCS